jgi:MFS superfamily sulfate permease-like transporter
MNQHPTEVKASQSVTAALRFDVIAGLTAAAVVLPKAMAYATVAGSSRSDRQTTEAIHMALAKTK